MKRLETAEAEARAAVDEWTKAGNACAAYPGVSALQMFDIDQRMLARIAGVLRSLFRSDRIDDDLAEV